MVMIMKKEDNDDDNDHETANKVQGIRQGRTWVGSGNLKEVGHWHIQRPVRITWTVQYLPNDWHALVQEDKDDDDGKAR